MAHEHRHHPTDLAEGRRITWAGMGINAVLIILKIGGGILGRSRALLADGFHSVSDLVSDVFVLVGLHFFRKERDRDHPYGHGKIETLVTLAVGVLLAVAAFRIGFDAAVALRRGAPPSPGRFTILIAALSLVSKELLYRATVRIGMRLRSEALVANAWHHRSDAWSSAVTFVGITLAVFVPRLRILDAYAALLVSFFVFKIAVEIGWAAARKIIDTSPPQELIDRIAREIEAVPGVLDCHDLHGRYYADLISMEVHVGVDPAITVSAAHRIADAVSERVTDRFDEVSSLLVHLDPHGEDTTEGTG
ncbi:MAG: cation transporter [Candidatus Krumholzibacteriota bacterium]|nr:cation transporter [Candidatus Krumholzibacteriota bacterium]